jgi:dienelactone hydrolase
MQTVQLNGASPSYKLVNMFRKVFGISGRGANRMDFFRPIRLQWTLLGIALLSLHIRAGSEELESPYNPPMHIEVKPGFVLEKETLTKRQIPTLLLSKEHAGTTKMPIVFALHGGAMPEVTTPPGMTAKEAWFVPEEFHDAPYTLATAGCLVVIIDAWWAGERYKPEFKAMVKENYFGALVRGWVETVRDIPLLIDALAQRADVDTNRVGLCGRSGGAIISLMVAGQDDRVKAVTSWVGFADIEGSARTKLPGPFVDRALSKAPDVKEMLQQFDPIHRFKALPPTAVLLMNNRTDPAVPLVYPEALHDKLKPLFSEMPNRLRFRVLDTPEPTHKMTKQDYDEGCAWLIQHLAPSALD